MIICTALIEDCKEELHLKLDVNTEEFESCTLPKGYEWCKSHIFHAKMFLLDKKDDLPENHMIYWG